MKDERQESFKRLEHVVKSIEQIEQFTKSTEEEEFVSESLISSAVLFHFSVIGEAVIHVENDLLEKYDYQWYKVRAFRNMIAHEYFNVKLIAVWKIIKQDMPQLKSVVKQILQNEF